MNKSLLDLKASDCWIKTNERNLELLADRAFGRKKKHTGLEADRSLSKKVYGTSSFPNCLVKEKKRTGLEADRAFVLSVIALGFRPDLPLKPTLN